MVQGFLLIMLIPAHLTTTSPTPSTNLNISNITNHSNSKDREMFLIFLKNLPLPANLYNPTKANHWTKNRTSTFNFLLTLLSPIKSNSNLLIFKSWSL